MAETDRERIQVDALLSDLNITIKHNSLREFGIMPTYTDHKSKQTTGDKVKGKGDKSKGKGNKNDKRTGKQRDQQWESNNWGKWNDNQTPKTWHNDWSNNWNQQNNKPDETDDAQKDQEASQKVSAKKSTKNEYRT